MAMASVLSRAQHGMDAPLVRVEVDVAAGLPAFAIVGLPEAVVKESKDRVRAAIANSNFEMPAGRIIVNLSPADLPKEGGRFDLPIAIGILLASEQLRGGLKNCELYGELSLSGEVRGVRGSLLAAVAAARAGHAVIVPPANAAEARLVSQCAVAEAIDLLHVAMHINGVQPLTFINGAAPVAARAVCPDMNEVRGQAHAKRALEVAAAGQHSLLLIGPPGTGKSMLAQRLPGLLPAMSEQEALDNAQVRSVAGLRLDVSHWRVRPFRSPHHTSSAIALVGGGSAPRPGEISLANNGILFLDEFAVRRSVNCRQRSAKCSHIKELQCTYGYFRSFGPRFREIADSRRSTNSNNDTSRASHHSLSSKISNLRSPVSHFATKDWDLRSSSASFI